MHIRGTVWPVIFLIHAMVAWNQAAVAQGGATRIDIGYTSVGAYARSNISSTIILSGRGRVDEQMHGRNSLGQTEAKQTAQDLGGARWQVIAQNRLRRTIDYENHYQILQVTVNGNSCTTTVTTRLRPGKTTYIMRTIGAGRSYVNDKPRYENLSCAIK